MSSVQHIYGQFDDDRGERNGEFDGFARPVRRELRGEVGPFQSRARVDKVFGNGESLAVGRDKEVRSRRFVWQRNQGSR